MYILGLPPFLLPTFRPPILTNIFLPPPNQAHTSHELKLASATLRTRRERWRRPWGQRVLDFREMVLGNGHPKTLTTANNIAVVFQKKGEHGKALERYQRALDGREKALSKDHPNTLMTVNNIAGVFYQAGEYDEALDHPDTIHTAKYMAKLRNMSNRTASPAHGPNRKTRPSWTLPHITRMLNPLQISKRVPDLIHTVGQ